MASSKHVYGHGARCQSTGFAARPLPDAEALAACGAATPHARRCAFSLSLPLALLLQRLAHCAIASAAGEGPGGLRMAARTAAPAGGPPGSAPAQDAEAQEARPSHSAMDIAARATGSAVGPPRRGRSPFAGQRAQQHEHPLVLDNRRSPPILPATARGQARARRGGGCGPPTQQELAASGQAWPQSANMVELAPNWPEAANPLRPYPDAQKTLGGRSGAQRLSNRRR